MPTGSEIRRKFLDFFVQKGHREVHSSSLVPQNDPTLLFTNAGMNQFKDVFLGLEKRDYNRATTSQKCVRAGGKHNDLENVGFTNRHHTFFEMLGNFSFGDYFKKNAIAYAWELITSKDWYGIDKGKLYVTVFNGEGGLQRDAEAYDLWAAQGIPKERIFEMGAKDNFWQMGDTGPCGPCSEIHYDMGPAASEQGHAECHFPCDCGRYVEIWNLVFMQFDRDSSGKLNPLPKPSIDTGMGLERVAAVLQGVISNYETDLFMPLIKRAAELTNVSNNVQFGAGSAGLQASLRIIADHSRAATFLISDGVVPSNEGRGYVLRKILRRAIRHGHALGKAEPFMYQMVFAVRDEMVAAYPELEETIDRVSKTVKQEEEQFARVLELASQKLETAMYEARKNHFQAVALKYADEKNISVPSGAIDAIARQYAGLFTRAQEKHAAATSLAWTGAFNPTAQKEVIQLLDESKATLNGESAFSLYDTFGLPIDFIQDAVRDAGMLFDSRGFDRAMEEQRTRARASWKGAAKQTANPRIRELADGINPYADKPGVIEESKQPYTLRFVGYEKLRVVTRVVAIFVETNPYPLVIAPDGKCSIVLEENPFYASSGGQVADHGWLYSADGNSLLAEVIDCQAAVKGVSVLTILNRSENEIQVGKTVMAVVDADIREATMRNHTATHLLHAGLREVLGKHVKQAGSLVAPNHLRFDFSHFTAVEDEELQDIEDIVNKEVLRNLKVETLVDVPIDEAINKYHAMALFGEKYGDNVRVVRIGDFSTELCGGTHTAATGEIGLIKILKEGSVSSGVRRVEAVTGEGSLAHFRKDHELEKVVSAVVSPTFAQSTRKDGAPSSEKGTDREKAISSPAEALKLELLRKDTEIKRLTRELDQARMKSASSSAANIGDQVKEVKGVKVLAHRVDNLERAQLRTLVDQLRDKIGSGVVVLGSASNGNVSLIVGVTKDLTSKVQAGKVIGPVAQKVGGKGGGRPDLAEAGGKDAASLDSALNDAYSVVESLLS
ncbi:MAG: alanine--tRNA ligase [Candidatus Sulfotelmatobacter sp.]